MTDQAKTIPLAQALKEATDRPWHSHDMEATTLCGPDHLAIASFQTIGRTIEQDCSNKVIARHAVNNLEPLVEALQDLLHHNCPVPHPITGEPIPHQANPDAAAEALSAALNVEVPQ